MNLNALKNTLFENVTDSNGSFSKHFHDTYTIGITHDGIFKSINSKKTNLAYKYSTRVINPGEVHYGASDKWKYTNFYPNISLIEEIYEEIFFERKIPLFEKHIIQDIKLYELIHKLFNAIYTNCEKMKIEIYLIDSLSYLLKNYTDASKKKEDLYFDKKIIHSSVEYIKDNIELNLSLDELAKNSNLSKYHFLRVFKKGIGVTPHHYIITQKVSKAKDLIINGEGLLNSALNVGFSDQSHFIRNFKKIYGYSPKKLLQKDNFFNYK